MSTEDYARAVKEARRNIRGVVRDDPRGALIDSEWIATNLANTREGIDSKWTFGAVLAITLPFVFLDTGMATSMILAAVILVESLSAVLVARRRTQRSAGELRQATLEPRSLSTFVSTHLRSAQMVGVLIMIAVSVDQTRRLVTSFNYDTVAAFWACALALAVAGLSLAAQRTAVLTPLPPRSDPSYLHTGFLRSMAIHDCLRRILVMTGLMTMVLASSVYDEDVLQSGPLAIALALVSVFLIIGALGSPWRWIRGSVWHFADAIEVSA